MTEAKRKSALERIVVLTRRNDELDSLIKHYEPSTSMEEMLLEIVAENTTHIQELIKATDKRYEFLFNFKGGGWNSEWAFTIEEAKELAKVKYETPEYTGTCVPDYNTFRVSTPADHQNLMSMFY
jgi:hypothetical protein